MREGRCEECAREGKEAAAGELYLVSGKRRWLTASFCQEGECFLGTRAAQIAIVY